MILRAFGLGFVLLVATSANSEAAELEDEAHELLVKLQGKPAEIDRDGLYHRLGEIGPEAREAVPWLIEHLDDGSNEFVLRQIGAEAVPALIESLRTTRDVSRRRMLISVLRRIGGNARLAVPALVEAAREEDVELQLTACSALLALKAREDVAVPTLTKLLRETRPLKGTTFELSSGSVGPIAIAAALKLGQAGDYAQAALPALAVAARTHPAPEVRRTALHALVEIDPTSDQTVRSLIAALDDSGRVSFFIGEMPLSWDAALTLGKLGRVAGPAILTLHRKCRVEEDPYHDNYVSALIAIIADYGPSAREYVPLLRREMRRELSAPKDRQGLETMNIPPTYNATFHRIEAARALLRVVPDDREAISVLMGVLADPQWHGMENQQIAKLGPIIDPRTEAAEGLATLGPKGREAIPQLRAILADELKNPRSLAESVAWALAKIDPHDDACVPVLASRGILRRCFSESPETVARFIDEHYAALLPSLANECAYGHDSDEVTRLLLALRHNPLPHLIKRMQEFVRKLSDPVERYSINFDLDQTSDVFISLGTRARPAVPMFLEFLASEHIEVRLAAARALGELRLEPQRVVPALVRALSDKRVLVRIRAAEALGNFGYDAFPAVPALKSAAKDDYSSVRYAAAEALGKIQASPVPVPRDCCNSRPCSRPLLRVFGVLRRRI